MKKVAFYTLGCKVNQYDTQAVSDIFKKEGYEIVDFNEKADVYVINTCTVTGLSDRKSRQMIRRAKSNNENSIIVVMGCYSQTSPEEVEKIPEVNLIMGTKDRNKIIEFLREIEEEKGRLKVVSDIMHTRDFEELHVEEYRERTRAFIKIQEGCNQFCSYCIIPYARGPVRSRKPEDLLEEIRRLAEDGIKEFVLTGIHIASYGKDLGNIDLVDIIKKVHDIPEVVRIRLGSIEPGFVTKEFIDQAKELEKLCPHYHISLQSGCDETLKRMNRKYTTGQFRNVVEDLRSNIPDVAITTDIMVGFPGESQEEFMKSYEFVKEISFAHMHVFKYSPRKGTPAARFKNQIPPDVKEERSNMLIGLSKEKKLEFNKKHLNRVFPVLFEQEVKNMEGYIEGLTPNYIRVICRGNPDMIEKIYNVRLQTAYEDHVIGEIIH
ncbi:MAG TPA: tRNA (N(6)-L-threonylcarbamoyladenosine(37)-C(2))-methylthiotransferase MtaB [Clostridiaceae bacterium]|nr:tRNA (N(6)-L-threonylcarbamoyladenosine(37)-C(2))-methylthiotransferase MtaB [Clostridiaceae bacterium]